ncbi:MAG: PepSY-like domain-containing protein [Candidatus Kapaibacterium sp.]
MKKYFSLLLLSCLTTIGLSQEMKISYKALPATVLQAFRTAYPNARIKNAAKEISKGETYYEITCKDGEASRTISFDKDGKITETEEELTIDKLPDAVAKAITKQYAKGKIIHIESSMTDLKTVYEVVIRDKKKKFEVVFSPEGNIVNAQ